MAEGNKWYYFSRKTQNRISGSGFWKPLGVDEPVFSTSTGTGSKKVGMKKHYVFYITTEATAEVKTNWVMQEFRLSDCGSTSTSGRSSKRRGNQKVVSIYTLTNHIYMYIYIICYYKKAV